MAKKLQIVLAGVATGIPGVSNFRVTPIDRPLNDAAAEKMQEAIVLMDMFDAHPGDGKFEEAFDQKENIRFKVLIFNVDKQLEEEGEMILQVVDA